MIRINSLVLPIDYSEDDLKAAVLKRLQISGNRLSDIRYVKKSLDARKKSDIRYVISVDVFVSNENEILKNKRIKDISKAEIVKYNDVFVPGMPLKPFRRPVIIGFGPAGLICAYKLAKAGFKPLVIERGADADTRTSDVNSFWNGEPLKPNSNVQFGEGGAGTFSDGKLNTMIHDKCGRIGEVFKIFTEHGADPSITYMNKPHIGTDCLKEIVKSIRQDIIASGGEVRFNTQMTDINVLNGKIIEITVNGNETIPCSDLILAIGHSARDTFYMLHKRKIAMERKAFAAGVRIQHPQELIGRAQFGDAFNRLPAADYKLTYNTKSGRGVYSFCMCPGGFVVNASSEPGRLVVNGMSYSGRNEATANSALVVTVRESDFPGESVLGGIELQRELEEKCFCEGNGKIPVQYLIDFQNDRKSEEIAENIPNTKGSWTPGNLNNVLPEYIADSLKEAFPVFGKSIRGYDSDYALLLGLESRTSSPVRIPRGEDMQSVSAEGIYPCGEGAGFAGGITSAAVDGLKVYEAVVSKYIVK